MIDQNAPAHPSHGSMGEVVHTGLTIRAEFAARAMEALLSNPNVIGFNSQTGWGLVNCDVETLSDYCLVHADALISALNEKTKETDPRSLCVCGHALAAHTPEIGCTEFRPQEKK